MMSRTNIANFTTFNNILTNSIEIQNTGVGLKIYSSDPNNPEYSFNPYTREFNVAGDLIVTGEASFETITISELDAGLFALAGTNAGDSIDIGIYGKYVSSGTKYAGVVRDASLGRWVFFDDVSGPIGSTITLDATKYSDSVSKKIFVNNGAASGPSITFNSSSNTGLYLETTSSMGITAGGEYVAKVTRTDANASIFELNTDTNLKFLEVSTLDDSTRTAGATTGHLFIQSTSGADRWVKFYTSASNYAGSVYTSPSRHFFITNTGTNLDIYHLTHSDTALQSPDYRSGSKTLIFTASSTNIESKLAHIFPLGSVGSPSITFNAQTSTGIYNTGSAIAFSWSNSNKFNIATDNINATVPFRGSNGSVSTPSISFSADTDTGLYRDTGLLSGKNISLAIDGSVSARFVLNTTENQLLMPSTGTVSLPSYSFEGDENTGIYRSAADSLGISLGGVRASIFGSQNVEMYKPTYFTPNNVDRKVIIKNSNTLIANNLRTNYAKFQGINFVDESLLLFYSPTDTGTLTTDRSDNGNNATNNGVTFAVTIKDASSEFYMRNVYDFTQNSDDTYLQLTSSLFNSITSVSISFWVKAVSGANQTIFSCMQSGLNTGVLIEILASGYLQVSIGDTSVLSQTAGTLKFVYETNIADNNWHQVVLILGPTNNKLYVDNTQQSVNYISRGNGLIDGTTATNSFNDVQPFDYSSIGVFKNSGSQSRDFTGYLKDFYVTQRNLSTTEIRDIYVKSLVYFEDLDAHQITASYIIGDSYDVIKNVNGLAASPSYSFYDDSDTGIHRPGENQLAISLGGTNTALFSTTSSTFSHKIVANSGLDITNGQTLRVGTSGTTSSLNVYGKSSFTGTGNTTSTNANLYIAPASTALSGSNSYFFTYFAEPSTTDSTTGSAYTIYIHGAPSGAITNPYALYINAGKTYIGGALQIPTGASAGYILTSDASGNATWQANAGGGGGGTFGDGTFSLPGIAFTSQLSTGFYRPASGQIGVSLGGTSYILFKTTGTDFVNGSTINIGSSGTTSPLNVFGLITGNNGLTISSGTSALQVVTSTTINASGLITGTNGLTITGANSSLTTLSTSGLISANAGITISGAQLSIYDGTVSAPSIAFTSDSDTGFYYSSASVINVSNNNQQTFSFNNRSLGNHISYNSLEVKPGGTNTRLLVEDTKLRASSNQTILNITPIIYFKFTTDPSTNSSTQDSSINKYSILSSNTPSFINNDLLLVSSSGEGLLELGAIQSTQNTRIETSEDIDSLGYLTQLSISIKFKLISFTSGYKLFEIYADKDGSASTKYIRLSLSGTTELNLIVHNGTSQNINLITNNAGLTTDVWYNLVLSFTGSGNSIKINGGSALSYDAGTGSSSTTLNIYTDWASSSPLSMTNPTIIIGGTSDSFNAYVDEFYIAPLVTSETAQALYRTQTHEVYTNKLQLGLNSGLVDEGYMAISDKGNNIIWDNSLQIKGGYVELTGTKVLRAPNGSNSTPTYSFYSDPDTGIYRIGSNNLGISVGGTNKLDIGSSSVDINSDTKINGGFRKKVEVFTGTSLTLNSTHYLVEFSYAATASDVTVTLPLAASNAGREYVLIKTGNGSGDLVIDADPADTIDDDITTSITLTTQYDRVVFISNGVDRWYTM